MGVFCGEAIFHGKHWLQGSNRRRIRGRAVGEGGFSMVLRSKLLSVGLAGGSRWGAWLCALIVASGTLCLVSSAQTAGPSADTATGAAGLQPHANPDEVSIDLVVRDKKKRPVLDLTSSDISVSDGGNPVQLADMHLVTSQSGEAATVVLLFDTMTPDSAKVARDITGKLLAMAPAHCSFAVLGVDRGLRLFQNFTQDRAATQAATGLAMTSTPGKDLTDAEKKLVSVEETGAVGSGLNASVEDRAKTRLMVAALEESQRIVQDQHAAPALAGLEALAKAQQSVPGRKIIVFFSAGLRANANTANMSKEVVQAANRAGIGIYAVDMNGVDDKSFDVLTMMYARPRAATFSATPGVSGYIPSPVGIVQRMATMSGSISDIHSTTSPDTDHGTGGGLGALAVGTGGFSISAGGDVREPLKRLVGDIGTYYEASYIPVLKGYDGQFHSIDIRPLRDGVTIQSRAGYFALAPDVAGSFGARPFDAPLLKILSDSPLTTDVGFQQSVIRLGGNASRTANELTVEVPMSHLELRKDERTLLYSAHVSVLAQIRDKAGVVVERFSEDFTRNGALETIDAARNGVVTLQRPFNAAPGDYVLEAAVLDRLGEKAGALRTEFTIPGPTDGVWLSDIAMVRRTEALTGAPDPADPMDYAKVRIVPAIVQQVPPGTPRISFFFRIHADPAAAGHDGKLDVEIQRDGKAISNSSTEIVHKTGSDTIANLATIQTNALTAGLYRAVFTYTQGDKSATRDSVFTVFGTPLAEDESQPERADDAAKDDASGAAGPGEGEGAMPPGIGDFAPGRFTASASGLRTPSEKYKSALLASARERALGYIDSLVNFKCIEVTDRFMDPKGAGTWTRHDKIAEMVAFENHEETRTVLEVNGQPGDAQGFDMKSARLEGEFGGVLKAVFAPTSKAEFKWKETDMLDGAAVQVFSYRVDVKNSQFSVTALPAPSTIVGFHGLVYIDDATRGTRRITMEAEGIPEKSPVHASAVTIDYDYVDINDHDYLMPVEGELRMRAGKQGAILHRIEFRDYHRFGSSTKIVGMTQ
jgi:VWFA-related protein